MARPSLGYLLPRWSTSLKDELQPETVAAYTSDARSLLDYVGETVPPQSVTRSAAERFIKYGMDNGITRATSLRRVSVLRRFFTWMVNERYLAKELNPFFGLKVPKEEPATEEECG